MHALTDAGPRISLRSVAGLAGLAGLMCGCSAALVPASTASKAGGPVGGRASPQHGPSDSPDKSNVTPGSTPSLGKVQPGKGGGAGGVPSTGAGGAVEGDERAERTAAEMDAKFKALPPGGSFNTKYPVSFVLARSDARVLFLPATPDGNYVDIPPASKVKITEVMQREFAKTNFRTTSYADGTLSDLGAEGALTIRMFKDLGGVQRPGYAGRGSASLREGVVTESILLHELGHAIGLLHQSEFDWRHRNLMPQFLSNIVGTGRAFLGSRDDSSIMATGDEFSEGDIRTINYLYPAIAGPSRPLDGIKPGTEAETGHLYIRGVEEKSLQIAVPTTSVPVDASKGWKWRSTTSEDFSFAAQQTPPCDASVVVGQPCAVRGFTCAAMSGTRDQFSGRDDFPGRSCATVEDAL